MSKKLMEKEAEKKLMEEEAERVKQRLAQMSKLEREVYDHRLRIIDEVFNIKCPRCKAVLTDFDGSLALICSRCSCGFCAVCLSDCGKDAHSCARRCSGGSVYGTQDQFLEHQRRRRQQLLDTYLAGITNANVKELLFEKIRKDAKDLQLRLPEKRMHREAQHVAARQELDDEAFARCC
jgi:hypothetical protein